ncbi:DUF4383 domain-containing protein [Arthrobacter castelli]|uniref:DUF4383 domain-containing protein n=1 Tax=Arthrobacter castelli TaxID=271431 RepID=UPI00040FC88B|nr:DUF4383 domain-containing protein [Arthrobacter castelli]
MTTASHGASGWHLTREHVRNAAISGGVVFLLLGVLGFIPGITAQYGEMTFAAGSGALLFGAFGTSILLNIVYLAVGIAGIGMSRSTMLSRDFLLGSGALFLLLWIYGLVIDLTSTANFLSFSMGTNWLHLVLGLIAGGLGVAYMARHRGGASEHQT